MFEQQVDYKRFRDFLAECRQQRIDKRRRRRSRRPKVIIDGQDQHVVTSVMCTTTGGNVNIAIGGAATGIAAVLTDANPPQVKSVGLGNVNGVTLGYTSGTGQGNASATKDGSTHKITGTATGVDMANPMQPVNKPFEIDVACS